MKRRDFLYALGSAALGWPLVSRAQQADRMRRIGVLMGFAESDSLGQAALAAFRDGLQKLGWTEGYNIQINTRWATVDVESIQRCAKELIALRPELVVSTSTPTTASLLQQTRTTPSFSQMLAIRLAAASSRACLGRAATPLVSPLSRAR